MSKPREDWTCVLRSAMSAAEQFHLLTDCATDLAFFLLDQQGRIACWNAGAGRLFGYREDEVLGRPFNHLFTPEDREMGRPESRMAAALITGRASDECWQLRGDGGRFWAAGTLTALRDPGGDACGFAGVSRDLTANRRSEDRLREADRRKDRFLAMLARELRDPLAVISGAAERLKVSGDDDDRSWCLDAIRRQVRLLARLADELDDTSHVTRGVIDLRREPLELGPVLDRAMAAVRPLLARKKLELGLDASAGPIRLVADPGRLEQAFAALLDDAVRSTPEGGRIAVTLRQGQDEATVEVRHDGVAVGSGIAEEGLPRPSEVFARGELPLDGPRGGRGIAPDLARTIVEMHGGRIAASGDETGRGRVFIVRLPVRASPRGVGSRIGGITTPDEAGGSATLSTD